MIATTDTTLGFVDMGYYVYPPNDWRPTCGSRKHYGWPCITTITNSTIEKDLEIAQLRDMVKELEKKLKDYGHVELLPCPFCKGKAYCDQWSDGTQHWVACESCEVEGKAFATEDEAIKAWNKRVK